MLMAVLPNEQLFQGKIYLETQYRILILKKYQEMFQGIHEKAIV